MSSVRRTRVERGIYRRPDSRLEIGFRDSTGRLRWRVVDGGIKAARAALAIEHAKRAKGEQTASDPRLTFEAAASAWWEAREPDLRPNSRLIYGLHLRRLREHFGCARLSGIGTGEIVRWLAVAKREGTASRTLRKRLAVLGAILDFAIRHMGHPGANPVRLLAKHERPKVDDSEPKRTLTDEEFSRLLEALHAHDRLLFALLAESGARKSEIAGLVWDDLDLDAMEVQIRKQLAPRSGEQRVALKTKNSRRTIVLTSGTAKRLREHYLASGRPGPDALVFRRRNGKPYNQSAIGAAMRSACERAGLDAFTPHSLRHTHASKLIASGWDVAEVAARLGDSIGVVESTYVHEWDAVRRRSDQRERLGRLYGNAVETTERSAARRSDTAQAAKAPDLRVIRDVAQRSASTG